MPGFTKLFSSIVNSTIWRESKETKIVWITMLAMADRRGVVDSSLPGLADAARVTIEECKEALGVLMSPDPFSRSTENEGRRVEEVDGGWRLLNYAKYRETRDPEIRREQNRLSKARERARECQPNVSQSQPESAHAEAEAEAENVDISIKAEEVYECYPRKVGKQAAIREIERAFKKVSPDALISAVKEYAIAVEKWPDSDRGFIPHPATWFHQGRWDDDRVNWRRSFGKEEERPYIHPSN